MSFLINNAAVVLLLTVGGFFFGGLIDAQQCPTNVGATCESMSDYAVTGDASSVLATFPWTSCGPSSCCDACWATPTCVAASAFLEVESYCVLSNSSALVPAGNGSGTVTFIVNSSGSSAPPPFSCPLDDPSMPVECNFAQACCANAAVPYASSCYAPEYQQCCPGARPGLPQSVFVCPSDGACCSGAPADQPDVLDNVCCVPNANCCTVASNASRPAAVCCDEGSVCCNSPPKDDDGWATPATCCPSGTLCAYDRGSVSCVTPPPAPLQPGTGFCCTCIYGQNVSLMQYGESEGPALPQQQCIETICPKTAINRTNISWAWCHGDPCMNTCQPGYVIDQNSGPTCYDSASHGGCFGMAECWAQVNLMTAIPRC